MGRARRDIRLGVPHHVVHRGNHQAPLFRGDDDRKYYLSLVHRFSRTTGTGIAGFCLMRNHVHFIAVPSTLRSISMCFGQAHRKYSEFMNMRAGTYGANWEGRFYSEPMSATHAINALRYIERNPVAAGIVSDPMDYPWSSAGPHCCSGLQWPLLNTEVRGELADPVKWRDVLRSELDEMELQTVTWLFRGRGIDASLETSYC
jgi:putative transposase